MGKSHRTSPIRLSPSQRSRSNRREALETVLRRSWARPTTRRQSPSRLGQSPAEMPDCRTSCFDTLRTLAKGEVHPFIPLSSPDPKRSPRARCTSHRHLFSTNLMAGYISSAPWNASLWHVRARWPPHTRKHTSQAEVTSHTHQQVRCRWLSTAAN